MKKLFRALFIALILTGFLATSVMAGSAYTVKIIAAQHDYVGNLSVTPDKGEKTLTLTFDTWGGYCITDAAIHVGLELDDFPQNKGGAIPGKFDYKFEFGGCHPDAHPTVTIMVPDHMVGQELILAVHTNVASLEGYNETGWAVLCGNLAGAQFPGKNWSAWFKLPRYTWGTVCGCP